MTVAELLGGAGAIIVAGAGLYYIKEVVRGTTRPSRSSWCVWAVIGVLGFAAARDAGAGPAALVAGVYAVAYVVTFALSLWPRYGKADGEWYDGPLIVIALAGLALWQADVVTSTQAVLLVVCCDGVALGPTIRGAWRQPESESLEAWSADAIGNALSLGALSALTVGAVLYPLYLTMATLTVATIVFFRRGEVAATAGGHNSDA